MPDNPQRNEKHDVDGWIDAIDEVFAERDHIHIWSFDQAPLELQQYSTFGGDEDWIIVLPASTATPDWLLSDYAVFGRIIQVHRVGNIKIYIAAHS